MSEVISLAELNGVSDVINDENHNYMLVVLESIRAANDFLRKYMGKFESIDMLYEVQAPMFGDEFSLGYKIIGKIELFEGRAYIFRPRFEPLKSNERFKWKKKIKEKNPPGSRARVREALGKIR